MSRAVADLAYETPAYAQGQIVTRAYAQSGRFVYERAFDADTRRVTFARALLRSAPYASLGWTPVEASKLAAR